MCSSSNFVNVKLSQQYPSSCNSFSISAKLLIHSIETGKGKKKKVILKCQLFLDVTLFVFLSLCSHMLPDRLSKGEEVSP